MRKLALYVGVACLAVFCQAPVRAQDEAERTRVREEARERERLERSHDALELRLAQAEDKLHEIVIRKSGKKEKDILVLKYNKSGELVTVIENGKVVSKKDFPKYRIRLDEALEARDIDELRPDLERIEEVIESRRRSDEEKVEALRQMVEELKERDSELARHARDIYLRLGALNSKWIVAGTPSIGLWREMGDEGRMTISIRKDGCYLNGRKLPADLSDRLLELRKQYREQERETEEEEESGESGSIER